MLCLKPNMLHLHIMLMFIGDDSTGGPCPVAHYCPEGTSNPVACPAGSYANVTGLSNCTLCPAAYYCPSNIVTYEVFPCPEGHVCPDGTEYADQFPCPKGYYRNETQGQSLNDCSPCPAAMYCGREGLTHPSGFCDPGRTPLSNIF